jgi:hypothetical protein
MAQRIFVSQSTRRLTASDQVTHRCRSGKIFIQHAGGQLPGLTAVSVAMNKLTGHSGHWRGRFRCPQRGCELGCRGPVRWLADSVRQTVWAADCGDEGQRSGTVRRSLGVVIVPVLETVSERVTAGCTWTAAVMADAWCGPGWISDAGPSHAGPIGRWMTSAVARRGCPADREETGMLAGGLRASAMAHGLAVGRALAGYCLWRDGARIVGRDGGGSGEPTLVHGGRLAGGGRGPHVAGSQAAWWGNFRLPGRGVSVDVASLR